VERRFNGAFDHWQPLPADPWYGVVELTCDPPAEAAQQLAAGHQVLITPRWFTPLPTSPLFQVGIALSLCATLGLSTTGLMQYRRGRVPEQDETDDDGAERHAIITEYGAEGAMLRVLGTQLRELVEYGNIDPHVLAAAEWALDRHRARAIRLMRDGLGPAGDLADSLDDLLERENIRARATGNGSGHRRGARRLLRLIEAIGDDPTRDQARRLLTQLEHRAQGPHQPPESLPLHYDESMLVE